MNIRHLLPLATLLISGTAVADEPACPPLLDHRFERLQDGKPLPLCQFAGKVLLVVNTASLCGHTGQYEGLEDLHQRLASRGLVVLGFPSNDFGSQEPGTNQEVAEFCRLTYGVRFPMATKITVKGPDANGFYRDLAKRSGSVPAWNFHKYLISRDGQQVLAFASAVRPDDPTLLARIEEFLK